MCIYWLAQLKLTPTLTLRVNIIFLFSTLHGVAVDCSRVSHKQANNLLNLKIHGQHFQVGIQ